MIRECITFGEPDMETEECITCWEYTPEIFVNCLIAEYEQIRPKRRTVSMSPRQGSLRTSSNVYASSNERYGDHPLSE